MASVFSLPPSLPGSTKNPDLCLGNPKLERPSRRPSDCCLNSKESLLRYHPRPMARLSVRYRRWGGTSQPTAMTTSTAGTVSFPGPSMHRTRSGRPPRDSSRSSAYSATNLLCFPGPENPQTFQLCSRWAREFGTISPCLPPAGSAATQRLADARRLHAHVYRPGDQVLALDPGSVSPPALPEAESPLHRSLHYREADTWGNLPPSTPSLVSYSPCIPRLTFQTRVSLCPRHRRTGSTTSSRSSRGTLQLLSTRDLGLPLTGRPLGISDRLAGLQARGKILC